jgi:hypothetical protein
MTAEESDWRNMPAFERPDRGILKEAGFRKFLIVRQTAKENLGRIDIDVRELFGCLSKLTSFLTIAASANSIDRELSGLKPSVAIDHPAAAAMFEAVVIHAGASLDRLAVFIGSAIGATNCRMSSHLYRVLLEAQRDDIRAQYLFQAMCQIRPHIEGILIGKEINGKYSNSCLRHDLLHNMSLYECPFSPFQIENDQCGVPIKLDAEFIYNDRSIALFHTTHLLIQWISFFVLYASSVCLARNKVGSLFGSSLAREWDFGPTIGESVWQPAWIISSQLQCEDGPIAITRITKSWPKVSRQAIRLSMPTAM